MAEPPNAPWTLDSLGRVRAASHLQGFSSPWRPFICRADDLKNSLPRSSDGLSSDKTSTTILGSVDQSVCAVILERGVSMDENSGGSTAGGDDSGPALQPPKETDRAATGMEGLDALLNGGLPRHHVYLVQGPPAPARPPSPFSFASPERSEASGSST